MNNVPFATKFTESAENHFKSFYLDNFDLTKSFTFLKRNLIAEVQCSFHPPDM